MNLLKLKGIIKERGKTYTECAQAIGKKKSTFVAKINGRSPFGIIELEELGNFLEMTDENKITVFLH